MKKALIIFLAVILCSYGCEKEEDSSINTRLIGQWEFKKAVGGFTGSQVVLPPANTKTVLSFNSGRQVKLFVNDQLEKTGDYELIQVTSIFTAKPDNAIRFNNFSVSNEKLISIQNDSLWLSDNHVESYGYLYVKVK